MVRDEKISLFYRKYTQEQREIIDYISGLIFEYFPTIKEIINEDSLKYSSTNLGSIFIITVKEQKVRFYFKKKKIFFNHIFKKEKSFYYLYFDTIKRINRDTLIDIFKQY